MKKGMLPKQEYELINVCMQTIEGGTPMTCSDCGRAIFNFATIQGKTDGKKYIVGLTCVKKLLNKTLYFDNPTLWEYESQVCAWQNAMNARKWIDKYQNKAKKEGRKHYTLELIRYTDKKDGEIYCYICMYVNTDLTGYFGHCAHVKERYKSVFNGLEISKVTDIEIIK